MNLNEEWEKKKTIVSKTIVVQVFITNRSRECIAYYYIIFIILSRILLFHLSISLSLIISNHCCSAMTHQYHVNALRTYPFGDRNISDLQLIVEQFNDRKVMGMEQ